MRNQTGISQLTGNDELGKDEGAAARNAQTTDSTQAATSDYMDRIQGVNTGGSQHVQPAAGAGGMTNPVLGAFMNNNTNNTTTNSTANTTNPTLGQATQNNQLTNQNNNTNNNNQNQA